MGESLMGEKALAEVLIGDIFIRLRPLAPLVGCSGTLADSGENVADLISSPLENEPLVAVDGCDVDVRGLSVGNLEKLAPGLTGLVKIGVRAFKNSV